MVAANFPLRAGDVVAAYAMCPAGKKPVGGGWFGPATNEDNEVVISRMEPDNAAYNVIVRSVVNYDSSIRVTAICAAAN